MKLDARRSRRHRDTPRDPRGHQASPDALLADLTLRELTREVGYLVASYLRVQEASTALASVERRLNGARRAFETARSLEARTLAATETRDAEAALHRVHYAWSRLAKDCGAAEASLARLVRRSTAGKTSGLTRHE
jgi:hypothetical protein